MAPRGAKKKVSREASLFHCPLINAGKEKKRRNPDQPLPLNKGVREDALGGKKGGKKCSGESDFPFRYTGRRGESRKEKSTLDKRRKMNANIVPNLSILLGRIKGKIQRALEFGRKIYWPLPSSIRGVG